MSAGFDAHRVDPMADLELTSGDFAHVARTVGGFAPRSGRVALFLEGGYDLAALHASVEATLSALLEIPYDAEESSSGGPGAEQVERAEKSRHLAIEAMLANPEGDETS